MIGLPGPGQPRGPVRMTGGKPVMTVFHARLIDGTGKVAAEGDLETTLRLPQDREVRLYYLDNITSYAYNQPGPPSGQAFSVLLSLRSDMP